MLVETNSESELDNSLAKIIAVQESLVTIEAGCLDGGMRPLLKNEVVYILPRRASGERLKAEILRVKGRFADAQVYEDTAGVSVGDEVEQSGELLSVSLGPGLLGKVYDGLQNPLEDLAQLQGTFLPRGVDSPALDQKQKWSFIPAVEQHSQVKSGDVLGTVQEGRFKHKIMVPFDLHGHAEVTWIQEAVVTVDTPVVRLRLDSDEEIALTLEQRWPVRKPVSRDLLLHGHSSRLYPSSPMTTTIRLVDTFFPIALGGTGCIPGPFGSGKTVLQHLIAKHSSVDIVIVVACGERAGEVVETITEFPHLKDPKTGGALIDRTIIICNTSSMPVAAREASMYTGITLGEYYRQMGYQVLLLADSTSRWAQAMRETSGRLEEIPGDEAFPAYLDSAIRSVYDRAYKRFYPAIDPLISWSRYLEQLAPWFRQKLGDQWVEQVEKLQNLLASGDAVQKMMQVSGEDGVSIEDYVIFQKALFLDMVYLQQDAFDDVDASVSMERQASSFKLVYDLLDAEYQFDSQEQASQYFTRLTGLYKNFNYAAENSPDYDKNLKEIRSLFEGAPKKASE